MRRMKKDDKRRLVGALEGAGGALVLYTMISIAFFLSGGVLNGVERWLFSWQLSVFS
jgi:hypothetical protein